MTELAGLEQVATLPGFEEAGVDTAQAVLEECAKFNEGVIAPLNADGDKTPSTWKDGAVTTTPGFKDAYRQYAEGGWQGLQHPAEFGGQGLPKTIGAACIEINNSANLSFALCPLLTDGAIEALLIAGSDELKQIYLPRMVSGEWTGTMNLTEPQAGSDLALVRTRAEPQADGSYKIFGTKIFITYGEHDMAENIVHLVLARVTGAPEGVKGISLFVVPKFMVEADGSLGARNDVHCVSIEHKLGIKASPTAVLQFGDAGGAVGYLVGEENRGLEYMFIMMNAARFAVGVQGIAIAERAYQLAVAYAKDRVQGRPVDGSLPGAGAIIHHPDVKRMLLTMRSVVEGCRAAAICAAAAYDTAHAHPDAAVRKRSQAVVRVPGAAGQGLQHRDERRGREPGRAGARRHGLHRGDRRRAALARRAHPVDLRRHDRDPGQRPRRPQDRARRRRDGEGAGARDRSHRSGAAGLRPRGGAGDGEAADRSAPGLPGRRRLRRRAHPRPTPTPRSPARCPTCCWPATWWPAGNSARALLVAQRQARRRRRCRVHAQQDRGRALLRRACADARAGPARQRRRRRGGDQRGGGGGVLRMRFAALGLLTPAVSGSPA